MIKAVMMALASDGDAVIQQRVNRGGRRHQALKADAVLAGVHRHYGGVERYFFLYLFLSIYMSRMSRFRLQPPAVYEHAMPRIKWQYQQLTGRRYWRRY